MAWSEVVVMPRVSQREEVTLDMDDIQEDMIREIGENSFKRVHAYDTL